MRGLRRTCPTATCRCGSSGIAPADAIVGEVAVATDLLARGVVHLGFFMVATARHGSGFAAEVYASYEAWAIGRDARWLRLGVVAANPRAESFWRAQGYIEVRRRRRTTCWANTLTN